MHRLRSLSRACALLFLALSLLSACGGGDTESAESGPNIVDAGQIGRVQLPDDPPTPVPTLPPAASTDPGSETASGVDDDTDDATAAAEADEAAAEVEEPAEPEEDEDAIPLAEDDQPAVLGLLDAFDKFSDCLDGEGFQFEGAPGQNGATPEDFEPAYMQALQKCAAESNIIQAVQASAAENASLEPEEIEERNEGYLVFEECLRDRGWDVGAAEPDEYGVLGPSGGGFNPPDGQTIVDSPDIRECASEGVQHVASLNDEDS